MTSAQSVTAPIRYGRRSEMRGKTYTMVFSNAIGDGRAIAVRCAHPVSSIDDLISEAEHLWAAEQNGTVRESNQIRLPFGDGKTSPVAVADVARAIAALLANPQPHMARSMT